MNGVLWGIRGVLSFYGTQELTAIFVTGDIHKGTYACSATVALGEKNKIKTTHDKDLNTEGIWHKEKCKQALGISVAGRKC